MLKLHTKQLPTLNKNKTMKRFITLMMSVLVGMSLFAKEPKDMSKYKLCGIWQNCYISIEKNKPVVHFTPYMKALNSDGKFVNMGLETGSRCCFIATMGEWSMVSDSVYVEHIDRSITDPGITGRDNKIYFRMQGDDFVVLKYKIPGNKNWGTEYWVRVIQPDSIEPGSALPRITDKDLMDTMAKMYEEEMQPTE